MSEKIHGCLDIIASQKDNRFMIFLLVGALNTLFAYSLYSLLLFLQLHYALASLLSTVGGVLFNFKTTGTLVFKSRDNGLLSKFIAVYCITYSVNVGFLKLFHYFDANMYYAGAIMVLPIALLSYTLLKKYVFEEANR